jgi:hypothetical protein
MLRAAPRLGGFLLKKGNESMIANPSSLAVLQTEWQAVVHMRERMQNLVTSTFAFDASTSPAFGDIFYNLPLRLAFDVLKKVLLQANDEGLIATSQQRLADLMDSASTSLPWNNWPGLREAVRRRNEVVHGGKLLGDEQCLQDIADVEAQLIAWRIITSA